MQSTICACIHETSRCRLNGGLPQVRLVNSEAQLKAKYSELPDEWPLVETSTPVVVLRLVRGLFPHGSLGVVRTLGRLGVPAWGFHDDRWAPAAFSRYDHGKLTVQLDAASPAAAVAYLLALGHRLGTRAILIPTEDVSTLFVDDQADVLARWFIFPKRHPSLSRSLANKQALHRLCNELDIATPQAVYPSSLDDVLQFVKRADFPVMLKSIDPEVLHRRGQAKSTTIAHDRAQLVAAYQRMEVQQRPNLMLQEHIPGDLTSHWMVSAYFNEHSDCLLAVAGQKLRESLPGAGFTTLGVCRNNEAIERATCNLLSAVGYRGIVDAEWRYDYRDGRYKLLDLNPRVGSQFRSFVGTNGLDAVRALYLDLTGQGVPATTPHEGRKWIVENHDALASVLYWRGAGLTLRDWLKSVRGVQESAWFARDDPLPFWVMCARALLERSRKAFGAERSRRSRERLGVRASPAV
jgi:D-aspartate ligase